MLGRPARAVLRVRVLVEQPSCDGKRRSREPMISSEPAVGVWSDGRRREGGKGASCARRAARPLMDTERVLPRPEHAERGSAVLLERRKRDQSAPRGGHVISSEARAWHGEMERGAAAAEATRGEQRRS